MGNNVLNGHELPNNSTQKDRDLNPYVCIRR